MNSHAGEASIFGWVRNAASGVAMVDGIASEWMVTANLSFYCNVNCVKTIYRIGYLYIDRHFSRPVPHVKIEEIR